MCVAFFTLTFSNTGDSLSVVFLRVTTCSGLLCDVTHESTLPKGVIYPRSFISFSVNGCVYHRVLGPLLCCELHPAVSLFNGASATLNLGPNFAFLPRELRRYFR